MALNERHSFNYLEATNRGVKFKNYVGIVQIDGLCIEILPKIDNVGDSSTSWRDVLLNMLRYCGKLKAQSTDYAQVRKSSQNLLEIYLEIYLNEVNGLIRKGLIKQYRLKSSNTLALKGKLELSKHIQHNLIHKERFFTTHQVYDYDHGIHQVLRKALDIVLQLTKASSLTAHANRVNLSFPEVDRRQVNVHAVFERKVTRKTAPYKEALALAQVIIENYSPSITAGSTKMISLLFDMNSLWEDYIYRCLHRAAGLHSGLSVTKKETLQLFDVHGYRLEPDIVVRKEIRDSKEVKTYVVDTKWKVPKKKKASSSDLRQIYAYNRYWKAEKGILLYPGHDDVGKWLTYRDQHDEAEVKCKLSFVNVLSNGVFRPDMSENILDLLEL